MIQKQPLNDQVSLSQLALGADRPPACYLPSIASASNSEECEKLQTEIVACILGEKHSEFSEHLNSFDDYANLVFCFIQAAKAIMKRPLSYEISNDELQKGNYNQKDLKSYIEALKERHKECQMIDDFWRRLNDSEKHESVRKYYYSIFTLNDGGVLRHGLVDVLECSFKKGLLDVVELIEGEDSGNPLKEATP